MSLAEDITFLWNYRTNKGYQFIASPEDVATMRLLLDGTPLEGVPGFEWVAEARAEDAEDEVSETATAFPEGLCGDSNLKAERCVFTKNHTGKRHSWQM